MIEISTPDELLAFLADSVETDGKMINDIDFCDFGQITTQIIIPINKMLDLGGNSLLNIYPIFCSFISSNSSYSYNSNPNLTIKNGYIPNVLVSNGILMTGERYNDADCSNYINLFTTTNMRFKFKNIGFSILGCNFYDYTLSRASILSDKNMSYQYTQKIYEFENCSFYIKTRNTNPMVANAVFKNCSLFFDCEYDTTGSVYVSSSIQYYNNVVFYFCVLKGKIKKSDKFTKNLGSDASYTKKRTLGEMVNCYVDIETDIPNIFINVATSKNFSHYAGLAKNPETTDITDIVFGNDTVYNADKYTATVNDGENNQLVIGGIPLNTAQMNDSDYLLQCGFLAVDEGDSDV